MATKKSEKKAIKEVKGIKGKKEPVKTAKIEKPASGKKTDTPVQKKLCRIISYEKMTPEIKALFMARYPDGYADFVARYPKPSGESFYAVSLYSEEFDFLIKVDVDVDTTIDEDYYPESNTEEEVGGESMGDDQARPDVNDLADSLADETSDPV